MKAKAFYLKLSNYKLTEGEYCSLSSPLFLSLLFKSLIKE